MRAVLAAVLGIMAIAAALPAAGEPTMLRRKDVQALEVFEAARNPLTLMIAGRAAGSGSVDSIATEVKGDALYVYVELGAPKPRLSGSFEFTVVVPDGVSHVRFGPDGDTIWQRQR